MRTTVITAIACSLLSVAAFAAPVARPAAAQPAETREAKPAAETQSKKGLKSWFKTLKERFLRRCESPWAPDPAPGQ